MQVSQEWVDSVNYWLRRYRAADSGGFQAPGSGGNLIPQRFGLFELKTNLTPGGICNAYLRLCTNGTSYTTDTTQITQLRDAIGNLRAFGRDSMSGGGLNGSYAIAQHDDFLGSSLQKNDVWNIVSCQQQASLIVVSAADQSGGSGPSLAVNATWHPTAAPTILDRGQDPTFGGSNLTGVTCYTPFAIQAAGGAVVGITCVLDGSIGQYRAIDGPC